MRAHWSHILLITSLILTLSSHGVRDAYAERSKGSATTPELETETGARQEEPTAWRRATGVALSIAPGLVLSGGGHWVVGRPIEARRLFWLKLGTLATLFASGAAVARSGASEYVTPWGVPLMVTSGVSWMSVTLLDLLGAVSSPRPQPQALREAQAPGLRGGERLSLTLQSGLRTSATRPQHLSWGLDWAQRVGRWAHHGGVSGADEQLRARLGGARALRAQADWGSWVQLAYTAHLNQRASVGLHQLELTSRWEGAMGALIGPSLSAVRAQLWLGWAGGVIRYPLGDVDATSAILGGLTLTHHSLNDRLRVSVGYDHRHDGWEGGAVVSGLGSGVLGFGHAQLMTKLSDNLWVGARGAWGSAHVYTLNLGWGSAR